MSKQLWTVAGVLALSCANVGVIRAQPPEAVPLPPPPTEAQRAETKIKVQRAVASANIMAFATETLSSQLPPDEFARWPVALRDALPYWLEFQPFDAWSPELQGFALGKYRALAADAKVVNSDYAIKNKAAIVQWLQEKAPVENTQLRFFLYVRMALIGRNQDGLRLLEQNAGAELTDRRTPLVVAFGHLMGSLSAQQKSELFANNMHLPVARLTQEQKRDIDELIGNGDMMIDDRNGGKMSIRQSPKSEIAIDFQFAAIARRDIAGKKDYLEVQIARPFNYRAIEEIRK